MNYVIFAIVAVVLMGIAKLTGLTYNAVNILVYYLLIPLSWAWIIDSIARWRLPWLTIAWALTWIVVFIATAGHFQSWCDWAFQKSVDFLLWFRHFKWNYYVASVYICVWVPLIIYGILAWLLIRQHPGWHWQPWAIGVAAFLATCWLFWWTIMSFGIKLEPHHQRIDNKYSLSAAEKEEICKDTQGMDANKIVTYAMKKTCANLDFQMKPTYALSQDEGNCITYAAMLAAIANEGFKCNGINARARHDVGTLKLFGVDLCKQAERYGGGFFADHDFVTIRTDTETYSLDPSTKDILGYDLKTRQRR